MLLLLLAFLGGALTIVSPCILPVLPFVFSRADKPFLKSGLPILIGMAVTFAGVATLTAVGGGWAVRANNVGRILALAALTLFGLLLIFPRLSDWATRPLVALGARLSEPANGGGVGSSLLLGVATGLLWAPCAGPILGLILAVSALQGASVAASLQLLAYALGAATSLALALLVGGQVLAAMKRSLGAAEWVRKGLGVLVIAGVAMIAFGLDRGLLTRISQASTASIEQGLVDRVQGAPPPVETGEGENDTLADEGPMPSLAGATGWINSAPLTAEALRGKVVLVDFWTYSCINCLRALPYVQAWAAKYKDQGLVVIGVHTPEFAFERDEGNVRRAVGDLKVGYPVALDNDWKVWKAFDNQAWPAHYFIDAKGRIRHHHFGEGQYDRSERIIQQLLAEAGRKNVPTTLVGSPGRGTGAAPDIPDVLSYETYVGYARAENFANAAPAVHDKPADYALVPLDARNAWSLGGRWTVGPESATAQAAGAKIAFRFHARDLHLVLGPATDGKPVRFRITIDGKPPGADAGGDVDASGAGEVTSQRLYQLVRQRGLVADRTFEIEFLNPGAAAYAFTFG